MSHGENVKDLIFSLQERLTQRGNPVVVDNMGTIETLFESFAFVYDEPIDTDDIRKHMKQYYEERGINFDEIEKLEAGEYQKIFDTIMDKSRFFKDDIHSRRVLWTDDCCISMVQFLVRQNELYCTLHLRSSDVKNKLFSDVNLIHNITRRLQDKLGIYNATILVIANSFHEIVIKDLGKVK
jgi:thymidylate synthase